MKTIEEVEADLIAWRELALKSSAALIESANAAKAWQELCERCQKVTDDLLRMLRPPATEVTDEDILKYYRSSRWVN
jgi:hypothetical protein